HPVLVGIGDGALFERGHGGERLCEPRLHRGEKLIRERHAAQIERQSKRGIVVTVLFETGPGHRKVRKTGERKPETGERRKEKAAEETTISQRCVTATSCEPTREVKE